MSTRLNSLEEVLKASIGKHVALHIRTKADDLIIVDGILKEVTEEYIRVELLSGKSACSESYINRKFVLLVVLDVWKDPE
jgi:hypothetical protein